jgi:proline racemase
VRHGHQREARLPRGRRPASQPGAVWRQESVTGSVFEGSYEPAADGRIRPRITGRAYVTAEATLLLDDDDPLCWGLR